MTRTRLLPSVLLLVVALTLGACDKLEQAVGGPPLARGPIPEVLVFMDSLTWAGVAGDALRAELAQPIVTLPNQQAAFKLVYLPLNRSTYDRAKTARNAVFAAPIDEDSPVGEFLRARIDGAGQAMVRKGRAVGVTQQPDLWARNQLVVLATAASDSALAQRIETHGADLRRAFNHLARQGTIDEMFARERQTDLEQALLDRHGFAVNIQHDYVKVDDTTATVAGRSGNVVRFRRVLTGTWRDFLVFVQDDVSQVPPVAELDALTNGLLETFARGSLDSSFVQMDDQRPIRTDTVRIGATPATETRGMWYMTNDLMGGPFIRYAFVADGRLFVYYGMVFSPDRAIDKREIFRQMEAIAHTFRTRSDT